jgi:hypothetical protein
MATQKQLDPLETEPFGISGPASLPWTSEDEWDRRFGGPVDEHGDSLSLEASALDGVDESFIWSHVIDPFNGDEIIVPGVVRFAIDYLRCARPRLVASDFVAVALDDEDHLHVFVTEGDREILTRISF